MSVELKTYGSDRRNEMGAAEAVRPMSYLNDWTRMRIGLQFSMDGVASNIIGTPFFAFGVCSGSTNVLAAATATHVVGLRPGSGSGTTPASAWTRSAGPPSYFTLGNGWLPFNKIAAVTTYGTNLTGFSILANNTPAQRSAWFIDIIKGSPNYTFDSGFPNTNTPNGAQSDLTDVEFQTIMELPDLSSIATVKSGYGRITGGAIAASEADGVLNHLFVYWDRSTHKFSFNLRHRKIS